MEVALCVIGRLENRYASEFVEHYKALGFDHIFILDNNYEGEEHFENFGQSVYDIPKTVITREYPVMSDSDPYYPINDKRNNALAVRYRSMADTEHRVIFGGRLAEYRYYDMDDVIASALTIAKIYI